jgi:hypothetical protein
MRSTTSAASICPERINNDHKRDRASAKPSIDPFSKQEVYVARNLRDRKLQRALLQFFKPENHSQCARRWNRPAGPP